MNMPGDLFLPLSCPRCDTEMNPSMEAVVAATLAGGPMPCPGCGLRCGVASLEALCFFSQAEWDAWDDTDATADVPDHYHVGMALAITLPPMSMN